MNKTKSTFTILALFPTLCFGQWIQVGNAVNGLSAGDRCGYSTAISGDGTIVAMGAIFNASAGSGAGQVRVFGWTNENWTQIGADINGETGGDQTGQAVSLSDDGSIVAIGEPFNNDLGFTAGQVRVFENINNSWSQIGQDLYGDHALAGAGTSVDLSADGSVVAFGAPNTPVNGVQDFIGIVRVFENANNVWIQKGGDINGDGEIIKFGQSVSLSADGKIIAIGQTGNPGVNPATDIGRVKIYQFVENEWVQLGNTIFGTDESDEFGFKVSLSSSGNVLAIGSYIKGEVKVFELINDNWTQIGNTLVGNNQGDSFGFSVALSSDASHLAVGARFINLNNDQPGSAYIFERQGSDWVLIGDPIEGVALADQAGFSVAISQNGSRVVISSTGNDDTGSNAGHVRVFENTFSNDTEELDRSSFVKLFPNPAMESIQIQSREIIVSYKIFSVEGRTVEQKEGLHQTEFVIDIRHLVSGNYFISIQSKNGSQRLTINKI
jgi:hypothetical protein